MSAAAGRCAWRPTTCTAAAGWTPGRRRSASPRCWPPLDADAIALQEVLGASQRRPGQAAELGAALGMGWVMAPTRHLRGALYGNAVLSRLPIRQHAAHDLSWKTCEPRGVQRVDLALDDDHSLHLYNVHLGTALLERRYQADRLAAPDPRSADPRPEGRARRLQRVGPRPGHRHPVVAAAQRRPDPVPQAPAHLSRASFRSSTSITSTTRDASRCGTWSWCARGRR